MSAALLTGQELGFSPMASLRSIDVIPPGYGSPALRAVALRALLQQHGHVIEVVETTQTRAVVRGRRDGADDWYPTMSVWTIDRARQLDMRGFNDPRGQWRKQPGNMLIARATGEMARWIASDVLLGLPYIVEEIGDGESEPAALDGAGVPPDPPAGVKRRGATRRTPKRAAPRPVAAIPPPNPPGGEGAAGEGSAAAGESLPLSPSQRGRLWAGLKRLGYTADDRDSILAAVSGWVGHEVTSLKNLAAEDASVALDAIQAEEDRRAAADTGGPADEEGPADE